MTWKRGHNVDVLEEEHHRIYGSKWALGLDQYEYLVKIGLIPRHRILDLGCGAGRAGIHLIDYLDEGNYVGVDGHKPSLDAFKEYEIRLNRLGHKNPSIILIDIEKERLDIKNRFDYVIAFSVFNHMKNHALATQNIVDSLKDGGILVTTFGVPQNYQSYGLIPIKSESLRSRLVIDKNIDWCIFKKAVFHKNS